MMVVTCKDETAKGNVFFTLKKLHQLATSAMWAIDAEYWDKCVSKVMKEAYEYMIFDGVITVPEETSSDVGDDDSESEVILSIENKTETTQVSTMSDDHTYSSDKVILKNQLS